MKYSKEILDQLEVIDAVLTQYGQPSVLENEDFIVDPMSFENYLKVVLNKSNCLDLEIICTSYGLEMNIDRTVEAFEITLEQFYENRTMFEDFVEMLFTSKVVVTHCGPNYTKVAFINNSDETVKTIELATGLYLETNCVEMEYPPAYTSLSETRRD